MIILVHVHRIGWIVLWILHHPLVALGVLPLHLLVDVVILTLIMTHVLPHAIGHVLRLLRIKKGVEILLII